MKHQQVRRKLQIIILDKENRPSLTSYILAMTDDVTGNSSYDWRP